MTRPEAVQPGRAVVPAGSAGDGRLSGQATLSAQQAAIALAYDGDDTAPRVLAKGRGLVAQAIIERAHDHGVYVHESRELVALLMQVDLDERIPPGLYRAVAELLVWVYRLEESARTGKAPVAEGYPPGREKRSLQIP